MGPLDQILGDDLPAQIFFYLSDLCFVVLGIGVSWIVSQPERRRDRWLRLTGNR